MLSDTNFTEIKFQPKGILYDFSFKYEYILYISIIITIYSIKKDVSIFKILRKLKQIQSGVFAKYYFYDDNVTAQILYQGQVNHMEIIMNVMKQMNDLSFLIMLSQTQRDKNYNQ